MNKLKEMAQAHWDYGNHTSGPWDWQSNEVRNSQIAKMRAAIAVLREPSEAMKRRIKKAIEDEADFFWDVYEVALDAMEDE